VNGKVNQLVTAVRSPIASIEQDDRPPASYRSRDVDFVSLQVDSVQRRQPITGYKMFGHFDSVGATLSLARLACTHTPELKSAR
jgi:hypothetical protein